MKGFGLPEKAKNPGTKKEYPLARGKRGAASGTS